MNVYDLVGDKIINPITSKASPDLRSLWDEPREVCDLNQTLWSADRRKNAVFSQLYYIPGLTTFCDIRGAPILTGFMSGCYLFRYRDRGALRAAHVGTHDTNKDWNDKAKAAWKGLAGRAEVTDIFGFDPARDVSIQLVQKAAKFGAPNIVGLWEGNGAARIGVIARGADNSWTLVGFEHAPLRPWASIQNDPKMA
jgi:hypothetical protein